jgi:uncharacterized membrane protein
MSTTFIGLVILPIVGNAAEHATAVTVAMKDKMNLSIGVAVGSSMQIALLVLPLVVCLGWILDKDCMTLYLDMFQIATLLVSVLLVNCLIQDGKSSESSRLVPGMTTCLLLTEWLEGILLMCASLHYNCHLRGRVSFSSTAAYMHTTGTIAFLVSHANLTPAIPGLLTSSSPWQRGSTPTWKRCLVRRGNLSSPSTVLA